MEYFMVTAIQPPYPSEFSLAIQRHIINRGFYWMQVAADHNAQLIVLPEYFNVMGVPWKQFMELGPANSSEILDRTCQFAKKNSAFILLPMLIESQNEIKNRAILIDDNGQICGHYDKIHPTLDERENLSLSPGLQVPIFDTQFGRMAIAICYDIYFPELFTKLQSDGVDLILFPSLQRSEHEIASQAILKTRAMDTQAYIIRSSYGCPVSEVWNKTMAMGQSCVVHPDSTILADAGHYEGIALAHIKTPFTWQRKRSENLPPMPVRTFLNQDRNENLQ